MEATLGAQNSPSEAEGREVLRVWSPLAVAVFGLLLGYPSGLVLALRNWRALGLKTEFKRHLIGGIVVTPPLIGILLCSSARVGRGLGLALSFATFSYLKEKLRLDIRQVQSERPNVSIELKSWYSGFGWVVLALAAFFFLFLAIVIVLEVAGVQILD